MFSSLYHEQVALWKEMKQLERKLQSDNTGVSVMVEHMFELDVH